MLIVGQKCGALYTVPHLILSALYTVPHDPQCFVHSTPFDSQCFVHSTPFDLQPHFWVCSFGAEDVLLTCTLTLNFTLSQSSFKVNRNRNCFIAWKAVLGLALPVTPLHSRQDGQRYILESRLAKLAGDATLKCTAIQWHIQLGILIPGVFSVHFTLCTGMCYAIVPDMVISCWPAWKRADTQWIFVRCKFLD